MTVKQRKVPAFTLIEVMLAVLIITIVIAGVAFIFAMGRGQIVRQKHYRVATQLAVQKLEELKATDYSNIQVGVVSEPNYITLDDVPYILTTDVSVVTDGNSTYKVATVAVGWEQGNNEHDVDLVTCIAP